MKQKNDYRKIHSGVLMAMAAAILFGIATPFAKLFLNFVHPIMMAGLLYLGAGVGLSGWWILRRWTSNRRPQTEAPLTCRQLPWLLAAIFAGGGVAPVLLMMGLSVTSAATASLLLNLEGVATTLLAWFVFRENFDRRILAGMIFIVTGGIWLSGAGPSGLQLSWGPLAILGACLCWGLDNNLTKQISGADPVQIAALRGLLAGFVNIILALLLGHSLPNIFQFLAAGGIGLLGYGISIVLYVLALRQIGTARTGAYFSTAPFIGAAIAIPLFHESLTWALFGATALMGIGIYLHLTENHEHEHRHVPMNHNHKHLHDEHHQHKHVAQVTGPHCHIHTHESITHRHHHYPDLHHNHDH